jgi:uncharacterized RDD family membrane protein YckC
MAKKPSKAKVEKQANHERMYVGGRPCARFLHRLLAYVIDVCLFVGLSAIILGLYYLGYILLSDKPFPTAWLLSRHSSLPRMMFSSIFQILWVIALTCFIASPWQATPGKRMLRLYVTDAKGNRLGMVKSFLRSTLPILIYLIAAVQMYRIETEMWNTLDHEAKEVVKIYAPFYKPLISKPTKGFFDYVHTTEGHQLAQRLERILPMARWQLFDFELKYVGSELQDSFLQQYIIMLIIWAIIMLYWYGRIDFSYQRCAVHDAVLGTRVLIRKFN